MLRRTSPFIVLAIIAALAWHVTRPATDTRPIRVFGSSMAPKLRGDHDAWVCFNCGYPFATATDDSHPAVCPNCYGQQPNDARRERKPGDAGVIDTLAAGSAGPRRWETIVFRTPEHAPQHESQPFCIKRVVGLPGETIEIRAGDVWINGERARKSLAQQRELAIPVHDSRYQTQHAGRLQPPRWAPQQRQSGWSGAGSGFQFRTLPGGALASGPDRPIDWLQYTHWRRAAGAGTRWEPAIVTDDYAYNRGESRLLHRVDDLLLAVRLTTTGDGQLCFRGQVAGQLFVVRVEPRTGRVALLCDERLVKEAASAPGSVPLFSHESQVEFSLVDHQVLLAIDGRLLLTHVIPPATVQSRSDSQSVAIGAAGLNVDIRELTLLRDVFYADPPQVGAITLGPDEYYVLGDNSPHSADSRTGWPKPGLRREYILGALRSHEPLPQ
jgi:type IV secretory pathway protease TraF